MLTENTITKLQEMRLIAMAAAFKEQRKDVHRLCAWSGGSTAVPDRTVCPTARTSHGACYLQNYRNLQQNH